MERGAAMISKKLQKEIKVTLIIREVSQSALADEFGVDRKRLNKVINGHASDRDVEKQLFRWLNKERVVVVGFNDNTMRRRFLRPLKRIIYRKKKKTRR